MGVPALQFQGCGQATYCMLAGGAQEENKKLRQKQKDKVQPKMGKLDIDYQVRPPLPCGLLPLQTAAHCGTCLSVLGLPCSFADASKTACAWWAVPLTPVYNPASTLSSSRNSSIKSSAAWLIMRKNAWRAPQVLHDAFFKHQTKPNLTPMGALYYEGKEFETRVRACLGGVLHSFWSAVLSVEIALRTSLCVQLPPFLVVMR